MYLKRLEIQGFKSFSEKVKLDFQNGITGVVGPNGSGKSNISDAVRWVLGEQSAKNLRGDKMEDIIFAGTANRNPLGFAEVSIILDNSNINKDNKGNKDDKDEYTPNNNLNIEYSEIKITRKVYRSSEAGYFINGTSCRLKDIHELFMDTGLGREGYSIIGQGKIDAILSTKTDDRRAIFEEASGIVKFKNRRTQTENKLEQVRKNLVRTNDIILEIESQIEPLFQQKQKTEKFLDMSNTLKTIRVNLFKEEYEQAEVKICEIKNQINDVETSINQTLLQKKAYIITQDDLKILLLQKEDLIKTTENKFHNSNIKIEQFNNTISLSNQSIEYIQNDIIRVNQELENQKSNLNKNLEEINIIVSLIQANQLEQNSKQTKLNSLTKNFDDFNKSLDAEESKIKNINNQIVENIQKSAELSNKITIFNSSKEQYEEKNKLNQAQINSYNSKLNAFGVRNEVLTKNFNDLILDETKNNNDLEKFILELDNINKSIIITSNSINDKNKKFVDLSNRYKILSELEKDYEGYFHSVKAILKEKEKEKESNNNSNSNYKNKFSGIRGAVGEVISVSKKYETAIEIALGGVIQNIITQNENDAKLAIEYLKKNKKGRATFLPISAINPKTLSDKEKDNILNENGVVGFADALINFDDIYKNIMSSFLGKVIIIDNIKNALKFAKKYKYAYKIVTLEGELINKGGALSGGSVHKKSGAIFSRGRELQNILDTSYIIENDLEKLSTELELHEENKANITSTIKNTDLIKNNIILKKSEIQNNLDNNKYNIQELELNIKNLQTELNLLKNELDNNFINISNLEKELLETKDTLKGLQSSISSHESSIEQNKSQKEEQFNNINNLKLEINNIENLLKSKLQDKLRLEQENINISKSNTLLEESLKNQEVKKLDYLENIESIKQNIVLLNQEYENLQLEHTNLDSEKQELVKNIENNNTNILNITTQIADIESTKVKLETKIENIENNIDLVIESMWEDHKITYASASNEYEHLNLSYDKLKEKEKSLKKEISSLGNINVSAIQEYATLKERYELNTQQRDDILKADQDLKYIISTLTKEMENKFKEHFNIINENFKIVFSEIFGGGTANLKLTDTENVLTSGIEISAQPAGKSLQNLSLLSGGERALTAISLLFAILKLKPSPFCILDEIEAALDDANVIRFAKYLKNFSDKNQFILITHKTGTMEIADVLYGVTMEEQGISKIISVELREAKEYKTNK